MTAETYNGWANYQTWRVNLEVCDDILSGWQEDELRFSSVSKLAESLKCDVSELIAPESSSYDATNQLAESYALAFIKDVNWREIAEHWEELISPQAGTCSSCGATVSELSSEWQSPTLCHWCTREWGNLPETDGDSCRECGAPLDDAGDGYNGFCPNCADAAEAAAETGENAADFYVRISRNA